MTNIVGNIGFTFTGRLGIKLNGVLVDDSTTPDTVYLPNIERFFNITAGVITSASFPETETKNVSVHLSIYNIDDEDPPEIITPALWEFDAIIPNVSSVEFSVLTPSGVVNNQLDTSALRIAKIIANDPSLAAKVAGAPFPRGEYDSGEIYLYGEMVSYFGKNYISKSVSPITGILPTVTETWYELVISVPPEISVVATGSNTVYGAGWNGSLLVPTQNTVYDKLVTVDAVITTANTNITNLSTNKANINSPNFIGVPTTPTPATSVNNETIVNAAYVKSNLLSYAELGYTNTQLGLKADLSYTNTQLGTKADNSSVAASLALKANINDPVFTGNPQAPTQALSDSSGNLSTTSFVRQSSRPAFNVSMNSNQGSSGDNLVINFANEFFDTDNTWGGNVFTCSVSGFYMFSGSLFLLNNDSSSRTLGSEIRVNGVSFFRLGDLYLAPSIGGHLTLTPTILFLTVGQTVGIVARNFGTGTSYSVIANTGSGTFWGYRLHI
jgi:hypothetical protein